MKPLGPARGVELELDALEAARILEELAGKVTVYAGGGVAAYQAREAARYARSAAACVREVSGHPTTPESARRRIAAAPRSR